MRHVIGSLQFDSRKSSNFIKFACPQCGRTNRQDSPIHPWPLPKLVKCDYCKADVRVVEK